MIRAKARMERGFNIIRHINVTAKDKLTLFISLKYSLLNNK